MSNFMEKTQCLFWALDQCVLRRGGLVIVMSDHWDIPHIQWISEDQRISHFVPLSDLPAPWQSVFGFEGHVKFTDGERKPLTKQALDRGVIMLGLIWMAWKTRNFWRHAKRTFNDIFGSTK